MALTIAQTIIITTVPARMPAAPLDSSHATAALAWVGGKSTEPRSAHGFIDSGVPASFNLSLSSSKMGFFGIRR